MRFAPIVPRPAGSTSRTESHPTSRRRPNSPLSPRPLPTPAAATRSPPCRFAGQPKDSMARSTATRRTLFRGVVYRAARSSAAHGHHSDIVRGVARASRWPYVDAITPTDSRTRPGHLIPRHTRLRHLSMSRTAESARGIHNCLDVQNVDCAVSIEVLRTPASTERSTDEVNDVTGIGNRRRRWHHR